MSSVKVLDAGLRCVRGVRHGIQAFLAMCKRWEVEAGGNSVVLYIPGRTENERGR